MSEEIPTQTEYNLPPCEHCGVKAWVPSEYLDFYCANCGHQIELEFTFTTNYEVKGRVKE